MKKPQERRYAPTSFEIRTADDGTIGFRGYAAVFNQEAYGEVIRPGAFSKTLAGNPDVRMLVNHGGVPIARTKSGTLALSIDEKGLLAEVDSLDPENPTVKELVSAMRRGDIDQMSFAFWPVLDNRTDDGVRELLEVSIDDGDVSVVTVPWYDETTAELNSLERAFSDLTAGRVLTPECRTALLSRVNEPAKSERGAVAFKAMAERAAEGRGLNGWTFSDLYPLLDEALDDMFEADGDNPYMWGYVCDVSDEWFTYWTYGGCFQCPYTVTAEGAVTTGEPTPVIAKTTYLAVPVDVDSDEDALEAARPTGMTLREAMNYPRVLAGSR